MTLWSGKDYWGLYEEFSHVTGGLKKYLLTKQAHRNVPQTESVPPTSIPERQEKAGQVCYGLPAFVGEDRRAFRWAGVSLENAVLGAEECVLCPSLHYIFGTALDWGELPGLDIARKSWEENESQTHGGRVAQLQGDTKGTSLSREPGGLDSQELCAHTSQAYITLDAYICHFLEKYICCCGITQNIGINNFVSEQMK